MQTMFSKKNTILIIGITLLLIASYWILPYSIPLILALFTAIILERFVKAFQKQFKLKKRHITVIIVILCFLTFISIITFFLSTKVIGEIIQFVEKTPIYINRFNEVLSKIDTNLNRTSKDLPPDFVSGVNNQIEDFLNQAKADITSSANIEHIKTIFTNIPKFLLNFLVYIIALFLFLLDLPRIKERIYAHLTDQSMEKVNFMTSRLSFVIFGYLKAQFLISIIVFLVSLISLIYIVPNMAIQMAFIIWIVDFIPIVGSIVILGPWAAFYLLSGSIALGIKLAILILLLFIIRRLMEPKIMGSQIGLSPLSTLISIYLGWKLFGLFGVIIGPLFLIVFNSAREAGIIKINYKL